MCVELHHIAAVANDLQETIRFYHNVLGLKFILKPSLFDGPKVCHFYWDRKMETFITFYHCPGLGGGKADIRTIGSVSFLICQDGIDFWKNRLDLYGIQFRITVDEIENNISLDFQDPDGLQLKFVFEIMDKPIGIGTFKMDHGIKGLYNVTILAKADTGLKALFTEQLKMGARALSENSYRFYGLHKAGSSIDVHTSFTSRTELKGCGRIHHMALKVQQWNHFMALYYYFKHQSRRTYFKNHLNNYSTFYFWGEENVLLEIVGQRPETNWSIPPSKMDCSFLREKQNANSSFYNINKN